ncbi:hypothetical protein [Paenibacillus sp. FSL R7-0273]|uniref:hypothetical protein n=1 Tax=Paenibacillus sp. FSL R7-0273 TaxID=1536772 RepID=UPI001180870C|nr:hypothetical protein [Paenibacillus sp. FSL R7-0273]
MSKHYTEDEKVILDWVTSKISHPDEMKAITPSLSRVFDRTDGAIRHQIEDRKKAQGLKGWIIPE